MDIILFIIGVFFIWTGQIRVSKKSAPWPRQKKTGRIIGAILLLPLIISFLISLKTGFFVLLP